MPFKITSLIALTGCIRWWLHGDRATPCRRHFWRTWVCAFYSPCSDCLPLSHRLFCRLVHDRRLSGPGALDCPPPQLELDQRRVLPFERRREYYFPLGNRH